MRKRPSTTKRAIQIVGGFILLLIIALYIGYPAVMALAAISPDKGTAGEPPAGFSEVTLRTHQGLRLGAWYAEPQNGAVIIVVHGAGSGRDSVRSYVALLRDTGFGVLALSVHGYDESEGNINRLGWNGTQDIGAAVDFVQAQDGVETIGGLGLSMGGEILLGAASEYPEIQAIVADGATFRSANDYVSLPDNRSLYRSFTQHVFTRMVEVFSGDYQPELTLLQSLDAADDTAFLFIAAGINETEITYNTLFHQTVPEYSTLWIIPNVGHTSGFSREPDLYERQVIEFFNAVLITP